MEAAAAAAALAAMAATLAAPCELILLANFGPEGRLARSAAQASDRCSHWICHSSCAAINEKNGIAAPPN